MGVPQQKIDWQNVEETPRQPVIAGQMPARALQDLLVEQTHYFGESDFGRWSQRRSLALIVTSATALWAALIATAHGLIAVVA